MNKLPVKENLTQTEQQILDIIDAHREEIIAFAKDIEAHPEPGFEEWRTADKVAEALKKTGCHIEKGLARTGVRATDRGKKGPRLTIIGEMDAIGCRNHPKANPDNYTAHACGHHAQLAAMVGAAIALTAPQIRETLEGSVEYLAVPAEEYIDADRRPSLLKEGIGFPGSGKSELIRTGAFDTTDIALTTHVHMVPVQEDLYLGNPSCNGFTAQRVTIRGKAAHAAIAPWEGVNALSIATSAIQMMGLMRETFREEDHVRLHNVIRKAGDVINSVPDEAVVETKIRAASLESIEKIQEMTDRAYDGAAYAFGGRVEREVLQGYMPVRFRPADKILIDNARKLGVTYKEVTKYDFNNACTDMGDLTQILPVVNFTFSGFAGTLHGTDFRITEEEKAYILPGKMLALTVYGLLKEDAQEAKKILADFTPAFTKKEYCEKVRRSAYEEKTGKNHKNQEASGGN